VTSGIDLAVFDLDLGAGQEVEKDPAGQDANDRDDNDKEVPEVIVEISHGVQPSCDLVVF
jgi:hypothetical protein